MPDNLRWRYGETNPITLPVNSATEVCIGDLVYYFEQGDCAMPASYLPKMGGTSSQAAEFHRLFAGVAMQRSIVGATDPIRVATTGVFEFQCIPASPWKVGQLIGPAPNGSGKLWNQTVDPVDAAYVAIGRCAKSMKVGDTTVLVDIVSTLMYGGVQDVVAAPVRESGTAKASLGLPAPSMQVDGNIFAQP